MSDLRIANRYALALIESAESAKNLDRVSSDVELIYNTIRQSKELELVLENPVIKPEKKFEILQEIFGKKINKESLDFLKFVIKKNREDLLFKIVIQYLEQHNEKFGIIKAEVTSSAELSDEQKDKLVSKLESYTGKKIKITFSLDKSIIGGFIVRMGDTIIDASLKHQLELLKEQFLKSDSSLN